MNLGNISIKLSDRFWKRSILLKQILLKQQAQPPKTNKQTNKYKTESVKFKE